MEKIIPIEDYFDQNSCGRLIFIKKHILDGKKGLVFSTLGTASKNIFVREEQLLTVPAFIAMQEYAFNGFLAESAVVSLEKI